MGVIPGVRKDGPQSMKSLTIFPTAGYHPVFVDSNGKLFLSSALPTINPNDGSWWLNGNTLQKSIAIGVEDSVTGTAAWRADEPSTLTLDGTDVAVWTDYLLGGTITSGVGQRCTYFPTGGPNNGPYIKKLAGKTLAVDTLPITTTPMTIYKVIRTPSILTNVPLLYLGFDNGSTGVLYLDGNSAQLYAHNTSSVVYRNIPRTEWMLVTIRFADNDTVSVEINDEPPARLVENNGGGAVPYTITALEFTYTNEEVAELRVVPAYVNNSLNTQIKEAIVARHGLTNAASQAMLFGDSHAAGLLSPNTDTNPFFLNLMTNEGTRLTMACTASTCFNNNNSPYDFQDIVDNYTAAKWASYKKIFCYGTNDCQTASGAYGWTSWDDWESAVLSNLEKFVNSGTDPSDMCLITPPYCSNPVIIGNLATVQGKILDIATTLGCVSIDWTTLMINAGQDSYTHPGSDGVHCNNVQQALLDTPLSNFMNS